MQTGQDFEGVTPGEDVFVHTFVLPLTRQKHVLRAERGGDVGRLCLVGVVGAAEAGDLRAALPERAGQVVGRARVDGFDAARLEQVGGETGTRGVRGDRAEGGEEDLRPRAGRREVRVGRVSQRGLGRSLARRPAFALSST